MGWRHSAIAAMGSLLLACGFDTTGIGTGSGVAEGTGTSEATTTNPTSPSDGDTGSASGEGTSTTAGTTTTTSSTSGDPSTTVVPTTGPDPDTDTGATSGMASTSGGESSGGMTGPPTYGECDFTPQPQCSRGETCVTFYGHNICSELGCGTAVDCPQPSSGAAVPYCTQSNNCVLDCDGNAACPNGMECVHIFEYDIWRCGWPPF